MAIEEPPLESPEGVADPETTESPEAARARRLDPANRIRRKTRAILKHALHDGGYFGLANSTQLALLECDTKSVLKKDPTEDDLIAYATENVFRNDRLVDWLDALERKAHYGNQRKNRSSLDNMVWKWKLDRKMAGLRQEAA